MAIEKVPDKKLKLEEKKKAIAEELNAYSVTDEDWNGKSATVKASYYNSTDNKIHLKKVKLEYYPELDVFLEVVEE